jgi:hypothetical protein
MLKLLSDEETAYLEKLAGRADPLVTSTEAWPLVETVAAALLKRNALSASEVEEAISARRSDDERRDGAKDDRFPPS